MLQGLKAAFTAMALLALAVGAVGQGNPITNGGFEEVGANGVPADWELLGSARVETGQAHAGQRALHLARTPETKGEVGLNRRWAPNSSAQGAMLAERKGGIRFWYKAVTAAKGASLSVQAIPMNDKPLEVGGHRATWSVPARHVGDGQWHQGALAYDFEAVSEVKWVHVGARLGGERAELWLDDFEWVDHVGAVLQSGGLILKETPGREGQHAVLTLALRNAGDRPLPAGSATVALPVGLSAGAVQVATPPVPPGRAAEVSWEVAGKRERAGEAIRVALEVGGQKESDELALAPEVSLVGLHAPRVLLEVGKPALLKLLVRNSGTAMASGLKAKLTAPAGFTVEALANTGGARPGIEDAVASWRITPRHATPLATFRARLQGAEGESALRFAVAARIPVDTKVSGRAYAAFRDNQAVIGTDKVRLILVPCTPDQDYHYGAGVLQARFQKGWRTVASLPRLGLIAAEGTEEAVTAAHVLRRQDAKSAVLLLEGKSRMGGCVWKTRCELTVDAGSDCIGFELSAKPTTPAKLLALEGPMLYAGDGNATPREDAVVPGIEWLVKGEESSNSLDFIPDHPDRVRYVPHPTKLTVPAVGMRFGDTAVGLLWDVPARQPSYAKAGALSLAFASPNRFEGHDNHLMGVFLPAVGEWVPENQRRASKPLPVAAGQTLTVRATLVARTGVKDALAVMDRYYEQQGFPEPLPYPRGDAKGEIAFSLGGYMKERALWNAVWNRWYSDLIVGFRPSDAPAYDLLRGAALLQTGEMADQARALAAEVLGGDERSRQRRVEHHADPGALRAWAGRVRSLIASQHPDGTWRFGGEKAGEWPKEGVNYKVLGPVGASEVGLSALNATQVVEYALATGDPEARAAGVKALEAARQFRVPRAAQVWEVPVHTPDILASARAMDACLAGYKLTGQRRYLDDAVYWARTGLPFVYVWNPPDQPVVRGATIPVFGGTSYVLSWLAVAVQWNGLGYSSALLDLAEFDHSFPWRRVAENIIVSGMYQQATEGDRFAQWPDAVNFIPGRKGPHGGTPPCFQPATIIHQTLRLLGWKVGPETVAVRQGDAQIALRGEAAFSGATWAGDSVRFGVSFAPPQRGAVEVIGVSRPKEVLLDGKSLPERTDVWAEDAAGWHWHESAADLEIRVVESGKHSVEVRGISRMLVALAPPLRQAIDFRFDHDADGWEGAHDLAPLTVAEGCLQTTTTGSDPYMVRDGLRVEGQVGDVLVIRLSAAGGGGGGAIFWGTEASPGFSPKREASFTFPTDGAIQEVRVPVGGHAGWAGQAITSLRVDPGGGASNIRVGIESIRLERAR